MGWAKKKPNEPKVQEPEPAPAPAPAPEKKPEKSPKKKPKSKKAPKPVEPAEETEEPKSEFPPPGYVEPKVLKCGHMNFNHHGLKEGSPKQKEARKSGFCCSAQHEAHKRHKVLNPVGNMSPSLHVFWDVRGLYEPVPKTMRRTPERSGGQGWPGMCCHQETGLYIGGLGNDCRYYHNGKDRCVVHTPKVRASEED